MKIIYTNIPKNKNIADDPIMLEFRHQEKNDNVVVSVFILWVLWSGEKMIIDNNTTIDDLSYYFSVKFKYKQNLVKEVLLMMYDNNYICMRGYNPDIDGLPEYSESVEDL
jgi:ABC-type uncharacterized transport system substrate-binding protein